MKEELRFFRVLFYSDHKKHLVTYNFIHSIVSDINICARLSSIDLTKINNFQHN